MKQAFTMIVLFISLILQAQDEPIMPMVAQPALIEFNGGMYNGNSVEVQAPSDLVENVIRDKFKAQGVKGKDIKGFMVYRNVRVDKIDPLNPIDAFVKVERKSRKEKEISTISLITTPVGQISDDKLKSGVATATVTPASVTGVFFSDISPDIANKVFEKNFAEQQDVVKKSEKKLKDLQDDQASIEKKIRNLQDDLSNNRKNQESQAAELEKKRNDLNLLLSKKPAGAEMPKKD